MKLLYYLLLLCILPFGVFAQQGLVSGKVTSADGVPLQGVSVSVENSRLQTVTSAAGLFELKANVDDLLEFSMIGFNTQKIKYESQPTLSVVLIESQTDLEDVVVVGYGTQKKVNLTGAVSIVTADKLVGSSAANASTALQGLASGVTVTTSSGQPGATGTIRIRGIGTLSNSSPLVLVDGVEGDINSIDPNLIESMSVLKDAASASIYGSRAANGVILITTKRAKGEQLTVNYSGYAGWQSPTNLQKNVNAVDHMLLLNEAYVNTGKGQLYSDELIGKFQNESASNPDLYPNTNWQDRVLTGSGFMQNHFVSINGGGEKVRFLTSAGVMDQKGLLETSRFQRLTLRNNTDVKFSDKLSMTLDLQLDNKLNIQPGVGMSSVFYQMNRIPANIPAQLSNGNWGVGWNGNNPVAYGGYDGGENKNNRPEGSLNASLTYKPFEWLEAKFIAAPKYVESIDHIFKRSINTYNDDGRIAYTQPAKSSLTEGTGRALSNNFFGTLTLDKKFDEHGFKFLLGASREDYRNSNISAFRDVFILPEYPVLDAGSAENQQNAGSVVEWALQSFFSRLNYDYKNKYLIEVNGRYDGSSRFAKGHKYGFFPSLSAGWRVSEEPFMQPFQSTINEMKLRGSWGRLGNQNIGNYPFISSIALGTYTFNKEVFDMAALNAMANEGISWETTEMFNVGLDVDLFSSLNVTVDYYTRKTEDILLELDIPLTIGLDAPYQNAGIVENRGWELGIAYRNYKNEFKYDISLNLSDVKNKVLDIKGIQQTGITINREGYAMNSIYGFEADGLFQSEEEVANHATQFGNVMPGDIKYKDQNNDGIINADDNVIIGSTIPRLTFGAGINASYKGFNLNLFFQGVAKVDGYLYDAVIMPFYSGGTVQEQHKDRWTPDNTNSTFPRLAFSEANNEKNSSFWLKNAAYVRLKNIQLGYDLPNTITQKMGLTNLRLYVSGRNLFTVDRFWEGHDVETPVGNGRGYPQQKVYTLGLNMKF